MTQLRNYQSDTVEAIRDAYRRGKRAPLVVLSTGGGKTTIFCYVAQAAAKKGNVIFIIAHREELIKQIADTLARSGQPHRVISNDSVLRQCKIEQFKKYGRSFVESDATVYVASVQTLINRFNMVPANPSMIIIDECFPSGTLVDGLPIEKIKINDMVRSVNHNSGTIERKRVIKLFKRKPTGLCTVKFDNGKQMTCTECHPIFVIGKGYINAKYVKKGMPAFWLQDMRKKRGNQHLLPKIKNRKESRCLLQQGVLGYLQGTGILGNNVKNEQEIRIRPNETQKPYEKYRVSSKNAKHIAIHGSQTIDTGWEWERIDNASNYDVRKTKGNFSRFNSRVCSFNKKNARIWIPNSLQARYSNTIFDDCYRDRWNEPFSTETKRTRCEKRRLSQVIRVESVEIHQQTSDGTFGGLCPDGHVYNIEVESNHNYFAGDVLVHNCHHAIQDNQWGKIINNYPQAKLLLVTATPIRSDGKGLGDGHGGFADELLQGVSMKWLVEHGYLSPYRYFAPPTDIDLTDVNTTAKGDYNTRKLSDAVDKPTITGDAVKHYLTLANGKRAVVFCASVSHAMHVSEQFNSAGVSSEFIEGKTEDRAAMIQRFATGQTMVLTSCDLISEGFDLPAIEVAILLRPTKSTGLYMQQVGRALRIFEGKTEAIILDHVQAWKTHGFPDDDREWTLEGVKKRKRSKDDDEEPLTLKHCTECYAIHAPAPTCPNCGHAYPVAERKLEQVEGELVELKPEDLERKAARIEQGKAQTVEQLMALGKPRKAAEIIVKAREEKQALISGIMDGLNAVYQRKRLTSMQAFGVTSLDVKRMKPKQLKELKQRIEDTLSA